MSLITLQTSFGRNPAIQMYKASHSNVEKKMYNDKHQNSVHLLRRNLHDIHYCRIDIQ